jgi:hypothetical protein
MKHTFRPDISTSQASGPQITRGNSQFLSPTGLDMKSIDDSQLVDYQAEIKTMDEPMGQMDYMHRLSTPPAPMLHSDFASSLDSTVAVPNILAK